VGYFCLGALGAGDWSTGVVMHQLVGMGEMREKIYLNLPHLPHLAHLPHLHSSQKDPLLMTTPLEYSLDESSGN